MFEVVIKIPERPETVGQLEPGVYRIGSGPACHIQIHLPEVSTRHAVLVVRADEATVEDSGSTNGTFVNGQRVKGTPLPVGDGGVVKIGRAELLLRLGPRAVQQTAVRYAALPAAHSVDAARLAETQVLQISGISRELRKPLQVFKQLVHTELIKRVNLRNLTLSGASQQEILVQARQTIKAILAEFRSRIPAGVSVELVEQELVDEAVGLGPLEVLLKSDDITEVMCNGHAKVYVEKKGRIYRTDLMFSDDSQLLTVIERIVAPLGRRVDESQPMVDARLPDGSRVNAIIPPLAIDGPALTIRKFAKEVMTVDTLITLTAMTQEMSDFLKLAVLVRKNILISGGTGTGKTTLLNLLSNFLPNNERIVTIEDAAELRLQKEHVVRLEGRPPNIEGRGEIGIRDLVRNALRMRPDRIVVGECRGGEALDMLQAMNTGHDGSLTTVHANTARDALARLETMVLMAGFDLPLRAIREQIASAVSLVVHVSRYKDGSRKISDVLEVTGMEGEVITTQEIFKYVQDGVGEDGTVRGRHLSCGIVPAFMEDVKDAGISFNLAMFSGADARG